MTYSRRSALAADVQRFWLSRITSWSLAALVGFSVTSLILAMLGVMRPWVAIPVGLAGTVLAARFVDVRNAQPTPAGPAAALVVMILISLAIGIWSPHEHILATRDSGTYVSTAAWVTDTGTLRMKVGSPLLDDIPVEYETVGFQVGADRDDLMPQFLHLFPSTMALVGATAGDLSAIYALNPVIAAIGLLCLYFFSRRLLSPIMSLLATGVVAASMPFLYFSRAPFTEALAFTFVFGALLLAQKALADRSIRLATGAGILFGGLMLTRIDGIVVLLGLVAYRTLLQLRPQAPDRADETSTVTLECVMDRVIAVSVGGFALAMLDAALFSTQYLVDHGRLIALVLVGILVVTVVGRMGPRLSGWYTDDRARLANIAGAIVGCYFLYAWLLRPLVEAPTRSDIYGISGLQRGAGVPIEPLRSYAELSIHWLVWYLGIPLVATALFAVAWFLRRTISEPDHKIGLLAVVTTVPTLLYIYRPSINPDHIWAMRRFVPLVLPGVVILAVYLVSRYAPSSGRWSVAGKSVIALAFLIPTVLTTQSGGIAPEFEGAADDLEVTCATLEDDSIVLFVGEASDVRGDALAPPLRGFCGVTVAVEDPQHPLDSNDLDRLRKEAASTGTTVWVVDGDQDTKQSTELIDNTYEFLELSLFDPPDQFLDLSVRLSAGQLGE